MSDHLDDLIPLTAAARELGVSHPGVARRRFLGVNVAPLPAGRYEYVYRWQLDALIELERARGPQGVAAGAGGSPASLADLADRIETGLAAVDERARAYAEVVRRRRAEHQEANRG